MQKASHEMKMYEQCQDRMKRTWVNNLR